ncbi:hypothetical protein DSUL_100033 [Desulfovibrionales bacterium]
MLKYNNSSGAAWINEGILRRWSALYKPTSSRPSVHYCSEPILYTATYEIIDTNYFEVAAAPDYKSRALSTIKKRKNLRVLRIPDLANLADLACKHFLDVKSLMDDDIVFQASTCNRTSITADFLPATAKHACRILKARTITLTETNDLLFIWAVETRITSSSVIFAKHGMPP